MNEMNQMPSTSNSGSNGKIILGIIVVLAIAAVIYFMSAVPASKEGTTTSIVETQDTTAVINQEINKVDLSGLDASLDADLKVIDDQLNGL
jgi:hypothetical protein